MAFNIWDVRPDTPINNFATFNPLDAGSNLTFSNGNTQIVSSTNPNNNTRSTIGVSSGKWYYEYVITAGNASSMIGIAGPTASLTSNFSGDIYGYDSPGQKNINGTGSAYGASFGVGDVIGVFFDLDLLQIEFFKNNSSQGIITGITSGITWRIFAHVNTATGTLNSGQNPSFSNNKTPTKVYTDSNGQGRFFYEPPAGALALCTRNLATPKNVPAEYIVDETNQHLLTYNGNTQISKFSPYATDGYSGYFNEDTRMRATITALGTNDFTISAYFYLRPKSGEYRLIGDDHADGYMLIADSNNGYRTWTGSGWLDSGSQYLKFNTWQRIDVTRSGSNTTLYVDGVSIGSATCTINSSYTFLDVGSGYVTAAYNFVKGYISNFRVVNGSAITPPTSNVFVELEAVTNTDLLCLKGTNFNDVSGNNRSISFLNGGASISDWSPYTSVDKQTGYELVTTENGGSFYFDGSGDSIQNYDSTNTLLHFGSDPFTIEFWAYLKSYETMFIEGVNNTGPQFYMDSSGNLQFGIAGTGPVLLHSVSSKPFLNSWNHICVVREGTGTDQTKLYLNGVEVDTGTLGAVSPVNGFHISRPEAAYNIDGYIADLRVIKGVAAYTGNFTSPTSKLSTSQSLSGNKAAVSASDTKLLLQPFQPKDTVNSSFFNVTDNYAQDETGKALTYVGNAAVLSSSPYKSGDYGNFYIPGNGNYMSISDSGINIPYNTVGGQTIEFWVQYNDLTSSSHFRTFGNTIGVFSTSTFNFRATPPNFELTVAGNSILVGSVVLNKWYHVAITHESSTARLFVNGIYLGSINTGSNNPFVGTYYLGGYYNVNDTEWFKGKISDLRIVSGQVLYTATSVGNQDFTPPAYPLLSDKYTTDGSDPANGTTISGTTVLLAQPGKVADSENVAAKDPDAYMKAVTYTGQTDAGAYNNGNVNVGFEPGIVWIKNRDQADGHRLFTVATGVNNYFQTDDRSTGTSSTSLTSFNQTTNGVGFSIGNNATVNTSGEKYIAWCWKTGSSTSNTDGSITSTVWKNEKSGVSIVQYSGNGNASSTVGHGLSKIDMFMSINSGSGLVFFPQILGDANLYINNSDSAVTDAGSNGSFGNFTNSTFGFRNGSSNNVNNVNASGTTYTILVFESVAGYSAFGSFTGNASADGPFVYTGFKPAYVFYKKSSSTSYPTAWNCFDNQRVGYNSSNNKLYLDVADYDRTGEYIDLLSNGFKIRTSSAQYDNENGASYIYAAFAEAPVPYATAR